MTWDWNLAGRIARVWLVALVGLGAWALNKYATAEPVVVAASAPADSFSAARAYATLGRFLGPEKPHPASSDENAAVRGRILQEFASLGIKTETHRGTGCNQLARYGILTCATVTDIVAEIVPGEGKAIVLMAHYDSVPAGPGASDDGSGVATILETARALKASGAHGKHPVIALISDGEEFGLLGAEMFVSNPVFRARTGFAVNVEARGNQGPSRLFQTSAGSGPLIDLYARSVPHYSTSSLFAEIYRALPNDTDLTVFLNKDIPSLNFAFSENLPHYHTPLDTRAHLSLVSLQHHGENLLGVTRTLLVTDYEALHGGDAIYISVLGLLLPRLAADWALPLALVCFAFLTLAAFLARGPAITWGGGWAAFAMPPALLAGAGLAGWLMHFVAQTVSGMPDPSNAYPTAMRIALGLAVWGAMLLASRMAGARAAVVSVWLWTALLGIVTAAFLPGISPYFLFPALVAVPLLLIGVRMKGGLEALPGQALAAAAAIVPLVIWMSLTAAGETLMGLKLHPLVTLSAAFGLWALLPVLCAMPLPRDAWRISTAAAFVLAIGFAIYAGTLPSYSAAAPQPLNLYYVEDRAANSAIYAADAVAPLPPALRAAAKFSDVPDLPYPFAWSRAYVAPQGAPKLPAPQFTVAVHQPEGDMHEAVLVFHGSAETAQMYFVIPNPGNVRSFTMNGRRFTPPREWASLERAVIGCQSRDCRNTTLTLQLKSPKAFTVTAAEWRFGLPAFAHALQTARPDTATTNRLGDSTILIVKVPVPGS